LKNNELLVKCKDVLQSRADAPAMEGWSVEEEEEEELHKLMNEVEGSKQNSVIG
jgi:hypothetical protein